MNNAIATAAATQFAKRALALAAARKGRGFTTHSIYPDGYVQSFQWGATRWW